MSASVANLPGLISQNLLDDEDLVLITRTILWNTKPPSVSKVLDQLEIRERDPEDPERIIVRGFFGIPGCGQFPAIDGFYSD